jgi:ATP phosphoribosyltransferase
MIVLVPKNSGLSAQVARATAGLSTHGTIERHAVRGEDVPFLSSAIAQSGRGVIAYTGEDLVDEWLAAGNTLSPRLRRSSIAWLDPQAQFGKPALCLIGAPNATLSGNSPVRIAVCARYWNLASAYVRSIEGAQTIECIPIQGALETVCLQGLADFIIDIVVTGRTAAAAGLVVHELISTSDLAVLEAV